MNAPQDREKAAALTSIRESLAFFGADVSDVSDEELEARVMLLSETVAKVGVTTAEAMQSLSAFQRALRQSWGQTL